MKIPKMPEEEGLASYYPNDFGRKLLTYADIEKIGKLTMTKSIFFDEIEEHTHEFVEIFCVTEGCGIHIVEGEEIRVRRGDVFLIDYGMWHTFQALDEPFAWINCIFRPEFLGKEYPVLHTGLQLLSYLHDHNLQPTENRRLFHRNLRESGWDAALFFEEMFTEYETKSPGHEAVLDHLLSVLLIRLARHFFDAPKEADTSFDRILPDLIRTLNQSPPDSISAKALAAQYFMSPSAFSTHFQHAMGTSFRDYMTSLRIRQACALLLTSDMTVGEIQTLCGYSDSKSFYKAFRRHTGVTPMAYRATYHNTEDDHEIHFLS